MPKGQRAPVKPAAQPAPAAAPAPVTYKARLFAHPQRPASPRAGGLEQIFDSQLNGKFTTYDNFFAGTAGLNPRNARLERLRKGSKVMSGTVLGKVAQPRRGRAPYLYFQIRPAGKGAPQIDPKPILDGWKLLEATAVYRASGKNVLYCDDGESDGSSIGQILLLPKPLLEKRVLSDSRIDLYGCGRDDIK